MKSRLWRRIAIMVLISGLVILFFYFQKYSLVVKRYTVVVPHLPEDFHDFTILHLSDLHNKEFGRDQRRLVDLINREDFDLVAVTGDLIDKRNPKSEPAIKLLTNLREKPIYFVPGNHEWWAGFQMRPELADLGVKILENSSEKIVRGNSFIWLLGVDDPYLKRDRLELAVQNVDDLTPKILLAHAPDIYQTAVDHQMDLVLVGHTHGGQVRIPFIGAVIIPGQGLFPEFDYGRFTSQKTTMIINGGLGESGLPIRLNIRPEIVLIKLVPEE